MAAEQRGRVRLPRGFWVFFSTMIALSAILGGANIWCSFLLNARFEASQRAQGQAIEAKLCRTLDTLKPLSRGLVVPPEDASPGSSRAFDQELVARLAPLAQLGPDIGCP